MRSLALVEVTFPLLGRGSAGRQGARWGNTGGKGEGPLSHFWEDRLPGYTSSSPQLKPLLFETPATLPSRLLCKDGEEGFHGDSVVKNLQANAGETQFQSLVQEDPTFRGATKSSKAHALQQEKPLQ